MRPGNSSVSTMSFSSAAATLTGGAGGGPAGCCAPGRPQAASIAAAASRRTVFRDGVLMAFSPDVTLSGSRLLGNPRREERGDGVEDLRRPAVRRGFDSREARDLR